MHIRVATTSDISLFLPALVDYENANLSYLPEKYKSMKNGFYYLRMIKKI